MLVPSIDLQNGEAVQLIGGKERALSAGDPRPLAAAFSLVGEVAVIDLDAALGEGSNESVIRQLLSTTPCRVGGGIRSAERAVQWLDWGARKIILGTKAVPELLQQLPKERVIAAVDAFDGEVVVDGWRTRTGVSVFDAIGELRDYVGGFLVTFVEREGRMTGIDLQTAQSIVEAAQGCKVTIAGGIRNAEEIAALDQLGADAQVGMALYRRDLDLAEAFTAPLTANSNAAENGLWPTVVVDEHGVALGLCWSNLESVSRAIETRCGVYFSRRRGLWVKGESSGNKQELLAIDLDCDRDALRFTVRQQGSGFCHLPQRSCWGDTQGITELMRTLESRAASAPLGSYSKRLFEEDGLLAAKLREETEELVAAETAPEVTAEAADVLYFTCARLAQAGVPFSAVEEELNRRSLRVTRRPGNSKVSS